MTDEMKCDFTLTGIDPQLGELLKTVAQRINFLQANCELLSVACAAQGKLIEQLSGCEVGEGPGPLGRGIIEEIDKALDKFGPNFLLDVMKQAWGKDSVSILAQVRILN
jgi:hypothetical protein